MPDIPREIEGQVIEAQIELLRLEAGVRRKVLAILTDLQKELADALSDANPVAVRRTAYQTARLEALMRDVTALIKTSYGRINGTMIDDLVGIAERSSMLAAGAVNVTIGVTMMEPQINRTILRRIASDHLIDGAPLKEWLGDQATRVRTRFLREVRKGMAAQETISEIVRRIRGGDLQAGVVAVSRREAIALVRTAVISVGNQARMETYRQSSAVRGLQWVSTLDDRTTPICRALDGKTWDNEGKPLGHKFEFPGPTAHWNCRSTQIPLFYAWDDLVKSKELAKVLERLNPSQGTRASMGGQVPASTTYEQWLRSQPVSRQQRVLGPGRWRMWTEGLISFEDLVDQSGRALTLEQLRS